MDAIQIDVTDSDLEVEDSPMDRPLIAIDQNGSFTPPNQRDDEIAIDQEQGFMPNMDEGVFVQPSTSGDCSLMTLSHAVAVMKRGESVPDVTKSSPRAIERRNSVNNAVQIHDEFQSTLFTQVTPTREQVARQSETIATVSRQIDTGAIPRTRVTITPATKRRQVTTSSTSGNLSMTDSTSRQTTFSHQQHWSDEHETNNWQPPTPPPDYHANCRRAQLTSKGITRLLTNARSTDFHYVNTETIKVHKHLAEKYFEQFYDQYLILGSVRLNATLMDEIETLNHQTEAAYTALMAIYNTRTAEIEAAVNADESVPRFGNQEPTTDASVQLGTVCIDPFNGDSAQWPAFKDTYQTYVHSRNDISEASKFWYLVNSLQGDAEEVIAGFSRIASNYTSAWNQIVATYDDEGRIVDQLIVRFIDIVAIDRPNQQQLMNLVNKTNTLVQSLSQYNIDATAWGPMLVPIIRRKLDIETRRAWRLSKPPKQIAKLQPLLDFIRHRANSMEDDNPRQREQVNRNQQPTAGTSTNRGGEATTSHNNQRRSAKKTAPCLVCKEDHPVYKCPKFIAMSVSQREAKVRTLALCQNCLRPNHSHNTCTLGACTVCGEKHNSKLLPCQRSQFATVATSSRSTRE